MGNRPRHNCKDVERVLALLERAGWSISYPSGHAAKRIWRAWPGAARMGTGLPDAVPSSIGGVVTVSAPIDAIDGESAAFALVDIITRHLPEAVVSRLDQDLVSIPDIAERTGRSREWVRLLVEGRRGSGGFPSPVGTVGDGIRVWPWASVLAWFAEALDEDLGERSILPEAAALVDTCLSARRRHLAHRGHVTWKQPEASARGSLSAPVAKGYRLRSPRFALVS